jgi:hypothetical protein
LAHSLSLTNAIGTWVLAKGRVHQDALQLGLCGSEGVIDAARAILGDLKCSLRNDPPQLLVSVGGRLDGKFLKNLPRGPQQGLFGFLRGRHGATLTI